MKNACSIHKLVRFLLVLSVCALPELASAASLSSATFGANKLTLTGSFTLPIKSVNFGGVNLNVLSSSATQIVAQLSPVPAIGTYPVTVQDASGYQDTMNIAVQAKVLEGWVSSNGTIYSGSGFTVKRNAVGNYTVSWPAGTLYQCCGPLPTVLVRSTWGSSLGNISYIWHGGDGSGTFSVDFSGVDTNFIFNMTQTY